MSEHESDFPPDLGDRLFQNLWEQLIAPEIERRRSAGELDAGEPIYRAQLLLNVDAPAEIRLNSEVRGSALVKANRDMEEGETVYIDDIGGYERFFLSDEDPNAAHFTLLRHSDGWSLAFDGQYNAARIAEHIAAADEFISSAAAAVGHGHLRPFVEDALHAAELLAKGELLSLPDEAVFGTKKHGTIHSRYHEWTQLGNADPRFAELLKRLSKLRGAATYLERPLELDAGEAASMLATLRAMRGHVHETAPSRDPNDSREGRVSITMRAAVDIKAGDLVGYPSMTRLGGPKPKPANPDA